MPHTKNSQRPPDAISWAYIQLSDSPDLKGARLTVREWDKRRCVVYEVSLRYGTGELHRALSNQPSVGPEFICERLEVPRIPMQCEGVDRYGRSLWEVANVRP